MAQSIVSIFSDGDPTTGQDLKGRLARPRKTALCDVKNILLSKATPACNEPLRKIELGPSKLDIACEAPVKEFVEETPAKVTLKQTGTFTIACDDKENESCCPPECNNPEDVFPQLRAPSEMYREEDIKYLGSGLFKPMFRTDEDYEEDLHIPELSPSELGRGCLSPAPMWHLFPPLHFSPCPSPPPLFDDEDFSN